VKVNVRTNNHASPSAGRAPNRAVLATICGALVAAQLVLSAASAQAVASAPPAGGYFTTLGPGSTLPSDAACASRVHRSAWEPRPENKAANNTVPAGVSLPGFTPNDGGTDQRARTLADRVNGNFKGTTDEIIQWAACKWGFADDTVRAQAVSESTWYQSTAGDTTSNPAYCPSGYTAPCPQSFGVLQVKASAWRGTFPYSRDATAFNVDYALMVRRVCYEGWANWLYSYPGGTVAYHAGDLWGCVGFWYSGNWYGTGALNYIKGVKQNLTSKPWTAWPDRSGDASASAVSLTATPLSVSAGSTVTVSWKSSGGTTARDWIGMYKTGAANTSYGEWHYTGGAVTGTMQYKAPATPGTYELRYLVNDSYTSVGTSSAITVN
jgi:hypothetical protein